MLLVLCLCILCFIESIAEYIHKGCWKDEDSHRLFKGGIRRMVNSVEQCYEEAVSLSQECMGVGSQHECWFMEKCEGRHEKHGRSDVCRNGKGGTWAIDVYEVKITESDKPCSLNDMKSLWGQWKSAVECLWEIKDPTDCPQKCQNGYNTINKLWMRCNKSPFINGLEQERFQNLIDVAKRCDWHGN